jgi:hypothetical protein
MCDTSNQSWKFRWEKLFWLLSVPLIFSSWLICTEESKPKLLNYAYNMFSQGGEDGVVAKIFDVIGTESKMAIEFGAWDGFRGSNTAKLWALEGWKAVLIESNVERFNQLYRNVQGYPVIAIHQSVGIGDHSLESLCDSHKIPLDAVDLLSIDIDSDDYYIFESLDRLRPRVIICEYNPTIPADLDVYPEYGKNALGCSVAALDRIAKKKGYTLVAITEPNAFFVRNDEVGKLSDFEIDVNKIRINRFVRYLISDYLGRVAIIASKDFVDPYGCVGPLTDTIYGDARVVSRASPATER